MFVSPRTVLVVTHARARTHALYML